MRIFGQFEARSADNFFVFVSPVVTLDLIKDTTAPEIVEVTPLGLLPLELDGADGFGGGFGSRQRSVTFRIDAADVASAVDAVGVAFGAAPNLDDVTAGPGLQRVQRTISAEADGLQTANVVVEDRAGNRSLPFSLSVLVDSVDPDIALSIAGADSGLLSSRQATLDVSSLLAGDDDLLVAVGVDGAVDENALLPLGRHDVLLPTTLSHGASVTLVAVAFDLVGNRREVSRTVVLDLRGGVSGVVVSDAPPTVEESIAGAAATLLDSAGATVAAAVVGADGVFSFPAVPEGRGYSLRVTLAGHADGVVRSVVVDADNEVDVPAATSTCAAPPTPRAARRNSSTPTPST